MYSTNYPTISTKSSLVNSKFYETKLNDDIVLKKYVIDLNKIKLHKNIKNYASSSSSSSSLQLDSEVISNDDIKLTDDSIKKKNAVNEKNKSNNNQNSTLPEQHFIKYIKRNGKIVKFYECGICKKDFTHQYTLIRHLSMHSNERNFVCIECGKAFRQLSTLSQHRAIHSIDRPFSCEICYKSFNRVSTLISHRKTHLDDKPYRCHICNKSFHQKGNLRNHIFIHTNERPYRCALCNRGFNQMSNLVCHAQKMHSDELPDLWCCSHCELKFQKRSQLRAHELETHHYQLPSSSSSTSNLPKLKFAYSYENNPFILPSLSSPIINDDKITTTTSTIPTTTTTEPSSTAQSQTFTSLKLNDKEIFQSSIVISAIQTDSMLKTKMNHGIPFAILHFIDGSPLLMRVLDFNNDKNLIRPVISDDFLMLRKQHNNLTTNTIDILLPIVAAIFQTLNSFGETIFQIKEPQNIYNFPKFKYTNMNQFESITTTYNNNNNFDQILINLTNYNNFEMFNSTVPLSDHNSIDSMPLTVNLHGQFYAVNDYNDDIKNFAIVKDCNWWKKDDEITSTTNIDEQSINHHGNLIHNDQFLNSTSTLKDEPIDILPSLSLDNNLFAADISDSLNDDEININLIRSFLTENRRFFADIDDLVSELLQQ